MHTVIDTTIEPDLSVHDTHCSVDDAVSQLDNDSEADNEGLNDDRWDNSTQFGMVHKCWICCGTLRSQWF